MISLYRRPQLERIGVRQLLDKHFPTHGNWEGESLGSVAVIWLTHILLQADHRLNYVQGWVVKRLETLKTFVGEKLEAGALAAHRLEQYKLISDLIPEAKPGGGAYLRES